MRIPLLFLPQQLGVGSLRLKSYFHCFIHSSEKWWPEAGTGSITSTTYTSGHLEIYINGQWGTMCGDSLSPSQATVACLLSCSNRGIGSHNCAHSEDLAIYCSGTRYSSPDCSFISTSKLTSSLVESLLPDHDNRIVMFFVYRYVVMLIVSSIKRYLRASLHAYTLQC